MAVEMAGVIKVETGDMVETATGTDTLALSLAERGLYAVYCILH